MKIISFINKHVKTIIRILVIIGVLSFGTLFLFSFYPQKTIQGTVVEILGPSSFSRNRNYNRIMIEEKNGDKLMLVNQDNWLSGKRDKVDKFRKDIKKDETYQFKTVGSSIPFMGQHPNILEYKHVGENDK